MRVIVVGAGRSGTNWALEIIRCSGKFDFTDAIQDAAFFEHERLPESYATKVPTEHSLFGLRNIRRVLRTYRDMKVVFTIRHPVDTALSKIYRGQPPELGGDTPGFSPDANLGGAVYAIEFMCLMHKHIGREWGNRMLTIRLEDLILTPEKPVHELCAFLEMEQKSQMLEAYKLIRVPTKRERYKSQLDKSQVAIHKRWKDIYGGFYEDKEQLVVTLKRELDYVVKGLGYE